MSVPHVSAVALCIGVVAVVTSCSGGPGDPARSPDASATALAAWVARNVPAGGPVTVTDASTRDTLRAAGVDVTTPDRGDVGDYRVSEVASGPVGVRAAGDAVTAVPVAGFPGTGSSTTVVDLLVAGAVADVSAAVTTAAGQRVAAGSALLGNPAVTVADPARADLAGGGLDLRAAALVAVLSTTGPLTVREIRVDPAESRVGRPARVLVVDGVSPGVVRAVAAATAGDYRPAITAVGATTTTLTWALAPVTSLTPTPTSTGVVS